MGRKDLRKVERELRRQGWRIERTSKGHPKYLSPGGGIVIGSGTPSDRRELQNLLAELRRRGFEWPPGRGGTAG